MDNSNIKNPSTDYWLARLVTDSIDGFNRLIKEMSETINTIAVENRHIVYPLINRLIDVCSQYAKNQNQLWYDSYNEMYRTNRPYISNPYGLPNYKINNKSI
jgi:hypothetical protein